MTEREMIDSGKFPLLVVLTMPNFCRIYLIAQRFARFVWRWWTGLERNDDLFKWALARPIIPAWIVHLMPRTEPKLSNHFAPEMADWIKRRYAAPPSPLATAIADSFKGQPFPGPVERGTPEQDA